MMCLVSCIMTCILKAASCSPCRRKGDKEHMSFNTPGHAMRHTTSYLQPSLGLAVEPPQQRQAEHQSQLSKPPHVHHLHLLYRGDSATENSVMYRSRGVGVCVR